MILGVNAKRFYVLLFLIDGYPTLSRANIDASGRCIDNWQRCRLLSHTS